MKAGKHDNIEARVLFLLILAEMHNCALPREAAMEMTMDQMPEIKTSAEWGNVVNSPHLLKELFTRRSQNRKLDKYGVTALCTLAHELGLEVDGSRRALVKQLEEA